MEQTEDVTATGDGDGGPPGPASGRLLAYGPAVPSSQTPLGNAGAFASAAWDVSGSPYALPSVQEPLGPHGGPGYGYMEHQHQHPHPHPHQHHAFVTPPPRTHLAPAQYGAQFTYDYEPRPLEEFDPHLEHGHGSRPYGATDAVGTFRPGSAFAAPPADYDVPGFANVTPAEATVSPYALLNVSSTAERAEDRNELPDDEVSKNPAVDPWPAMFVPAESVPERWCLDRTRLTTSSSCRTKVARMRPSRRARRPRASWPVWRRQRACRPPEPPMETRGRRPATRRAVRVRSTPFHGGQRVLHNLDNI